MRDHLRGPVWPTSFRFSSLSLFLLLCSPHPATSITTGPLFSTKLKLPRDGPTTSNLLPGWEISYTAENYLPVCGTSSEIEGAIYWSNSMECDPAMATFNSTTNPAQNGLYDLKGVETKKVIGEGEQLCLCFGLEHINHSGIDLCVLVGDEGQVMGRRGLSGALVAVGLQGEESDKSKMLPSCAEFAAQKSAAAAASPTSSAPNASNSPSTTASAGSEDKKEEKGGLTLEVIVGIAVGLPGALLAIVTMVIYVRKQHQKRATRYNNMSSGSEKHHQWWKWKKSSNNKVIPMRPIELQG